jgi:hypothetical protein
MWSPLRLSVGSPNYERALARAHLASASQMDTYNSLHGRITPQIVQMVTS